MARFTPVIPHTDAARPTGFTARMIPDDQWQRFFDNLEKMGIITLACQASGVGVRTVYNHIEAGRAKEATPEAAEWLGRYDDANRASLDRLEAEAFRRGHDGVQRPMFTRDGKPIMMPAKDGQPSYHYFETTHDSGLLTFLMKARDPAKFRDRVSQEISGPGGKPIQTEMKVIAVPAIEEDAPE